MDTEYNLERTINAIQALIDDDSFYGVFMSPDFLIAARTEFMQALETVKKERR